MPFHPHPVGMYNQGHRKIHMRFDDLNWMDVEEYLKSDDRLMIVLGACEQHGYLSLAGQARARRA